MLSRAMYSWGNKGDSDCLLFSLVWCSSYSWRIFSSIGKTIWDQAEIGPSFFWKAREDGGILGVLRELRLDEDMVDTASN